MLLQRFEEGQRDIVYIKSSLGLVTQWLQKLIMKR